MSAKVLTMNRSVLCDRYVAIRPALQSVLAPFILTSNQYVVLVECQGTGISASRHTDDMALLQLAARSLIERHVNASGGMSAWKITMAGRCILQACRVAEKEQTAEQYLGLAQIDANQSRGLAI